MLRLRLSSSELEMSTSFWFSLGDVLASLKPLSELDLLDWSNMLPDPRVILLLEEISWRLGQNSGNGDSKLGMPDMAVWGLRCDFLVCVWERTVRVELGYFQRKLKAKTFRNWQTCAAQSDWYFDLADIEIDKCAAHSDRYFDQPTTGFTVNIKQPVWSLTIHMQFWRWLCGRYSCCISSLRFWCKSENIVFKLILLNNSSE